MRIFTLGFYNILNVRFYLRIEEPHQEVPTQQ